MGKLSSGKDLNDGNVQLKTQPAEEPEGNRQEGKGLSGLGGTHAAQGHGRWSVSYPRIVLSQRCRTLY